MLLNTIKHLECLTKDGKHKTEYSHQAPQLIICHPDQKKILLPITRPIKNRDKTEKRDCEINISNRLPPKLREQHSQMDSGC